MYDKFGNVIDKAAAERAALQEMREAARAARAAKVKRAGEEGRDGGEVRRERYRGKRRAEGEMKERKSGA